jgi:Fe2+ or Zn2+ uptake regulation protein
VAGVKTVDELTEEFHAKGLKVTPQRQAIFRVLNESTVHPTAESIYAQVSADMPTISLRTVYQTLNDLAAMGELHAVVVGTGSTRFDPNLDAHHHLVCEGCGRIVDVPAAKARVAVPTTAADEDFEVRTTEIVFRGRCAECRARPAGSNHHQGETTPHG